MPAKMRKPVASKIAIVVEEVASRVGAENSTTQALRERGRTMDKLWDEERAVLICWESGNMA